MTPEEKSLLERTYKMAEDNNRILLSIRRSARWGSAMRYVYWFVIIALSVGAYYFIQPYVDFLVSEFSGSADNATSSQSVIRLLKSL
jgi:hypothetical protein